MILGPTSAPAAGGPVSFLRPTVEAPKAEAPLRAPSVPRSVQDQQVPTTVRTDRPLQASAAPKPVVAERPVGFPARPQTNPRAQKALTDFSYQLTQPELDLRRRTNADAPVDVSTQDTATPMSWKKYDALDFDQKAAVDFNTLLVNAREKDLLYPEPISGDGLDQYNADVESIFGKGGASKTVAPNVIALLKTIDFKAIGQDLDEYLSLERAISSDELKDFTFSKEQAIALKEFDRQPVRVTMPASKPDMGSLPEDFVPYGMPQPAGAGGYNPNALVPGSGFVTPDLAAEAVKKRMAAKAATNPSAPKPDVEYAAVRTPGNLAAIDTEAIRNAFTAYKRRLEAGDASAFNIETSLSNQVAPLAMAPPGYGLRPNDTTDANRDKAFETSFGWLMGNPNQEGLNAVLADFGERGWRPETQQLLWQYINDRTKRDIQYSGSKDAEALRAFLGWK